MYLAIAENMKSIEKQATTKAEVTTLLVSRMGALLEGLDIQGIEERYRLDRDLVADIAVKVRVGRMRKTLIIEVRTLGEPRLAREAISRLRELTRNARGVHPVFAARYVSERSRDLCREEGVGYMDLVGNVHLRFGSVLVDRVSPSADVHERRGAKQLFAPKATRVVRALLTSWEEPARITALARRCAMSPGGVHWVVRLLEDRGFVERDDTKRVVLSRPGELLDAWASTWSIERFDMVSYFSLEKTPEAIMGSVARLGEGRGLGYALTMMAGASLVAPFVRFGDVWVYVSGHESDWVDGLDLRPVEAGGNIVLVRPHDEGVFMDLQEVRSMKVVSNVQLYVDLYNYPARGREQAEFLREHAIGF